MEGDLEMLKLSLAVLGLAIVAGAGLARVGSSEARLAAPPLG